MKEFLSTILEFRLGSNEDFSWHEVTRYWAYKERKESLAITCPNFKALVEVARNLNHCGRIEEDITLFRKRLRIRIQLNYDSYVNYTEKSYPIKNPVQFRIRDEVFHPTMKWVYNNLDAEAFMEYIKDKGVTTIIKSNG